MHYIPNIGIYFLSIYLQLITGIVTSVKSKQFIDRKTEKQTKDLPEPKDSIRKLCTVCKSYAKKKAFGSYVINLVTEKPVAKNFEELKIKFPYHYQKLSVVCNENWNIAMGPIFGQLQFKYHEAYLQQLCESGLIQKCPNSKL